MLNAKVIATANATLKHSSLNGKRMLLVQAFGPDSITADGDPLLAVDTLGAGVGDEVVITSDGLEARRITACDNTPVRWTVIGICDA